MRVNQTYIVVLDVHTFETTQLYYVYEANFDDIKCSMHIIAVNGAGENDPSKNMSIPSPPDIRQVAASLTHQLWEHDGDVRVNISFEVRHYMHQNLIEILTPMYYLASQVLFGLSNNELV